ncbi:MAG: VCBS repeat-containing protein [Phycisphaerae bacterium]
MSHTKPRQSCFGFNRSFTLLPALILAFGTVAVNNNQLWAADCNSNGVDDVIEIASGTSDDCNTNGLPDDCDVPFVMSDQKLISYTIGSPLIAVTADLDGDGDQDFVAASPGDNALYCFENVSGLGDFTLRQTILLTDSPSSLFVADIDGNGSFDLVYASQDDDTIAWVPNVSGIGNFGNPQIIEPSLDSPQNVIANDLDGDGDVDVISVSFVADEVVWYENVDGLGTFSAKQLVATINAPQTVFATDIDSDGDTDVLTASYLDDKIAWFSNLDGAGNFGAEQIVSNSVVRPSFVIASDLNGDGKLDVLSASGFGKIVSWFANADGFGNFGGEQMISNTNNNIQSLSVSDIDGDDDLDVLVAAIGTPAGWHPNIDGLGSFAPHQPIGVHRTSYSLSAADLDGDGDDDVLSASPSSNRISWFESSRIKDCNANKVPDDCDISGGTSIDCNNNGVPDECELVVEFSASSGSLSPFYFEFPQQFEIESPPPAFGDVTMTFTARSDFGENFPHQFAFVDINGVPVGDIFRFKPRCETTTDVLTIPAAPFNAAIKDRKAVINFVPTMDVDSCSGSFIEVTVRYAINFDCNANGILDECELENNDCNTNGIPDECEPDCNANGTPDACDIDNTSSADVNTNSVPDECELDCDGTDVPDAWEIAHGTSSDCNMNRIPDSCELAGGTAGDCNLDGIPNDCEFETVFSEQLLIDAELQNPWSVYATDLDGDGDQDVLSASILDNTVVWYENTDGLGNFGPPQIISTEVNFPRTAYAADLDGDSDQDVLSASHNDNKVAWYENMNGAGTFGPQNVIDASNFSNPWSVRAADLDGDNDLDIVAAYYGSGSIRWNENLDGLGTFGPQQEITHLAYSTHSVHATDLDGDGDVDVLYASRSAFGGTGKIAWYENLDGSGNFGILQDENVISYAVQDARTVFAEDLDGDGDADVISGSSTDGKIAWYENIDGLSAFGPQQIITTAAANVWSVFAADLDNDGDIDVLSASGQSGNIAWYENTDGLGTFGQQQIIVNTTGLASVFASDLNGDGKLDVLSASTGDRIAWYENITINDCNNNESPDDCESDADGDNLIDACDPCAGGLGSGDSDANGVINLDDFANLEPCLAGPGGGLGVGCECFDFDSDGDNDLYDFAAFIASY